MKKLCKLFAAFAVLLFSPLVINVSIAQQVVPVNVLDTLEVTSATRAYEGIVDDPNRTEDIDVLFTNPSSDFISCVRVPAGDLLCLDGSDKIVKAWDGTSLTNLFRCDDNELGLRKPALCTAHTFGLGANFIAGVNKGKSYSIFGIPDPTDLSSAIELYTGRPLVQQMGPVENEAAEDFPHGAGILGIEQRSDAVFFPIPAVADPIVLVKKRGWEIRGKVTVESVDVWQINNPATNTVDNYVVATMSDGWIRAVELGGNSGVIKLFDIVAQRNAQTDPFPVATECPADEEHYNLEVSERTSIGYLTDKASCQITGLKPVLDAVYDMNGDYESGSGKLVSLAIATETDSNNDTSNLILSTVTVNAMDETEYNFPVFANVSEGVDFDLVGDQCDTQAGCTFISGQQGADAATLQEVTIASGDTSVTAYQLKGLLDCPYIPEECVDLLDPDFMYDPSPSAPSMTEQAISHLENNLGVLFRLPGAVSVPPRPEEFAFNMTPTLPAIIRNQIPEDSSRPDGRRALWKLPDWHAQAELEFRFEGIFFNTTARTRDVLTLRLNVTQLQGFPDQGCETADDLGPDFDLSTDGGIHRLRLLDITTRVSERDPWINGPQSQDMSGPIDNFQDTLTYEDCGSTRNRGGGVSVWPYNLKVAGCQGVYDDKSPTPELVFEGTCFPYDEPDLADEMPDDAALAKVYVKRYNEMRLHLDQLACMDRDGAGTQPISEAFCIELRAIHDNGWDKLHKALVAAVDDKDSAPKENFGAVASQLNNYHAKVLEASLPTSGGGDDPVNRRGEQAALAETLQSWLEDKVIPSAQDGFDETDTTWIEIPVFPSP